MNTSSDARESIPRPIWDANVASAYFVRRRRDTDCHFIQAMRAGRGPRLDVDEFEPRIAEIMRSVTPLRTFMSMCSIAAKALTFAAEISTPNVATYA